MKYLLSRMTQALGVAGALALLVWVQGSAGASIITQQSPAARYYATGSSSSSSSSGGGEAGPTRYTATHYVACDASGSGNGLTPETAWTPNQAKAAVAGNIVQWLQGSGGLCEFPATEAEDASWTPTNSGTEESPIIHYAEYAASALSDPTNNPLRTEVSHDGTSDGTNTDATGRSSVFGNGSRSHIVFDGFLTNWANAKPSVDGGWYRLGGSAGGYENIRVLNFYIQAGEDVIGENYPAIWAEGIDGLKIMGGIARDLSTTVGPNHNEAVVITYGCENMEIAYNDFSSNLTGIYIKGTAASGTMFNSGSIHHNLLLDNVRGMRIADVNASVRLDVHHNLIGEFTAYGVFIADNNNDDGRNVDLTLNTFANPGGTATLMVGISNTTGGNFRFRDNLYQTGVDAIVLVEAGDYAQAFEYLNYNWYAQTSGTFGSSYNGGSETTIAGWRTRTSAEANSTVTSSNPFTNMGAGDYTVTGSPLTASSTGGEIGAYEGSDTVGPKIVIAE